MASISALYLSGIRSYDCKKSQKINFQNPLTLIWGKNGSGKTTIIQALKYITTGSLPPQSDRGKNFVEDLKLAEQTQVHGQIKLKFISIFGKEVTGFRKILLSNKKKNLQFKSIEQSLKTTDDQGKQVQINHQCTQIQAQIPYLLGASKAILEKIIFCHQDDSLWPFSDNITLRNIFDQLFQTNAISKILQSIKEKIKEHHNSLKLVKQKSIILKNNYQSSIKARAKTLQDVGIIKENCLKLIQIKKNLENSSKDLQTQRMKQLQQIKNQFLIELGFINNQIKQIHQQLIHSQCQQILTNLPLVEQYLDKIKEQLENLNKEKTNLTNQYEKIKQKLYLSDKQKQINQQITRCKQVFPQLSSMNNKNVQISLKNICHNLKTKQLRLVQVKSKYRQIEIPNLKEVSQIQKISQQLFQEKKQLQKITRDIQGGYKYLYRQVDQNILKNKYQISSNIQIQLLQLQGVIKIKRQQLQKYKSYPAINKSLDKNKLQFGVEIQKGYIQYCVRKNKCLYCSKPLNKEQLDKLKNKCQSIISKTQKKLQQQKQKDQHCHKQIDPEIMIKQIEQYLRNASKKQIQLKNKYEHYKQYISQKKQNQINQSIKKQTQFISHLLKINNVNTKPLQFTLESFKELCIKCRSCMESIKRKENYIQEQLKRKQQNAIIQNKRINFLQQKKLLEQQINILQKQLEPKVFAENLKQRIENLMNHYNSEKKSNSKGTNIQEVQSKLQQINKQIFLKNQKINKLDKQIKFTKLQNKKAEYEESLQNNRNKIKIIDKQMHEAIQKRKRYDILKNEHQKLNSEIRLRMKLLNTEVQQDKKYLIQIAKLKILQKSIADLELDYKSLERATNLMHDEKMDQINKQVDLIWTQIYHGSDIQTIKILSSVGQDSKRKKSYHYRIVMIKNGKQIDMKGRCSMGQKVLASVVIRLALSEAFAAKTRIITLDQPTTNLDRKHIANLANQLCNLIQFHKQNNFQLIIISHDLEFIQLLKNYANVYYQIERSGKFSTIKRKEIQNIFNQQSYHPQME